MDQSQSVFGSTIVDFLDRTRPAEMIGQAMDVERVGSALNATAGYAKLVSDISVNNGGSVHGSTAKYLERLAQTWSQAASLLSPSALSSFADYATDATQRGLIFLDIMRQRGNNFNEIERRGVDNMLAFDYELVVDGRTLAEPINYSLVKIRPPQGVAVRDDLRPYVIIDPRAGHGSGIGGFKNESEVGVAIAAGHPVYFATFSQHPQPGQTLAHVCRGEAEFVREVCRRHPDSPKPVVIGNCQGGWAAMLLAATNPDLTGPVVANGSPLSYWSGVRGKNPLRYLGGLTGGVVPALMMADLGNGEFDGANLVLNFEQLSPGNTWWKKYYDLFAKGDSESERFLAFERWWSAFYLLTRDEIRWIVETLFVGNQLARGGAYLDSGLHVDLRNIRAPIILFASHGDNITPVPQAVNWVTDLYKSVHEIQAHGQRIIYTVHDSIGHLGIFVSSSVAMKQHKEIDNTLELIEALPPGLYEMKIVDVSGDGHDRHYKVAFEERQIEDLAAFDDDRGDETPFAAVSKLSEFNALLYQMTAEPFVKAMGNETTAKTLRALNPPRLQRSLISDLNPLVTPVAALADAARADRREAAPDNPFRAFEQQWADLVEEGWNLFRDWRDAAVETFFYTAYTTPVARALASGVRPRVSDSRSEDPHAIPDVTRALDSIALGGYPNALVRILILLAKSRHEVRRDRLERSNEVLSSHPPFDHLPEMVRNRIIRQQTLIVEFEPELAVTTLPQLLPDAAEREKAMAEALYVLGDTSEMSEQTAKMLARIRRVLALPAEPARRKVRQAT